MRRPLDTLAIEQFDRKLAKLRPAAAAFVEQTPPTGWLRSIRSTLGISARALARRCGLSHASVIDLERRERTGAATLASLRRAANALDADFVYAIIPRQSLQQTITTRARELARERVAPIARSMKLESQALSTQELERQIDALAKDLESHPRSLWR